MGIGRRVSSSLDICAEAAAALDWFYFILFFSSSLLGTNISRVSLCGCGRRPAAQLFQARYAVCRTAGSFSAAEQDEVGVHKFQFTFKYNEFLFSIFSSPFSASILFISLFCAFFLRFYGCFSSLDLRRTM